MRKSLVITLIACFLSVSTLAETPQVTVVGVPSISFQIGTMRVEIPGSLVTTAITMMIGAIVGVAGHHNYHRHVTGKL